VHVLALLSTVLLLASTPGCGPVEEAAVSQELGTRSQEITSSNGLAMNGIAMNGIAMNGLAMNGLAMNGLTFNGLSSEAFSNWFQQDPALAGSVMHYLIGCAVRAGQSRTYTHPQTGAVYTWEGSLGLTPDWASGRPATTAEQRVITACLAAHANRFGLHLPISVLGRGADGAAIPTTRSELKTYSVKEACFFGNLFNGEGIFVGLDVESARGGGTTTRACEKTSSRTECEPLVLVGRCQRYCTRDGSGPFYASCSYKGVTYAPITTRMRQEDFDLLDNLSGPGTGTGQ
jgi:hypothetical protein